MTTIIRDPGRLFAPATVMVEHRADGSRILRSPMTLGAVPAKLGEHLERWAAERAHEKIAIPDTEYDSEFWRDVDDEGVGGQGRY